MKTFGSHGYHTILGDVYTCSGLNCRFYSCTISKVIIELVADKGKIIYFLKTTYILFLKIKFMLILSTNKLDCLCDVLP